MLWCSAITTLLQAVERLWIQENLGLLKSESLKSGLSLAHTSRFVRFKQIDLKEVPNTVLMIFMWFGEGKNKTKLSCGGNRLLAAHIYQNIQFECCRGNRAGRSKRKIGC